MEPPSPLADPLALSPTSVGAQTSTWTSSINGGLNPLSSSTPIISQVRQAAALSDPTPTTPAVIAPVIGTGTGLLGRYYGNLAFDSLQLTRTDPTVNFNWNFASPGGTIAADKFSVRWTGKVQPEYSETYTFYTLSDDGIRVWVNGQQLIDHWALHGATEDSGTIALVAGQAYDIKIDYFQNTGSTAAFLSWSSASQSKGIIPQSQLYEPDLTLPTADLLSPISTIVKGGTSYQFSVFYNDATGVKRDTIDNQDILVKGSNNFSQLAKLVSVSSDKDGSPLTAIYSIDAPGGVWDVTSTGDYTITLQASQVSDIDNNFIPVYGLGAFRVDLAPPTAQLMTPAPAVGGSARYSFSVVYNDNTLIYRNTINEQDLLVSGPNNFSQLAKLVSISSDKDSSSLTVIYSVDAPNGVWDAKNSGTYTITMRSNEVSDTSGNFVPAGLLGSFRVSLAPPTAKLTATNPVVVGSPRSQFSVVYSDDTNVKRETIDNQDLLVTGPNNFSQLAKLVSVSSDKDGSPLTAIYSIDAPGGVWDANGSGTYTITLQANQISDIDSNFSPTNELGTFRVDLVPPTAKLTATSSVIAGSPRYQFSVLYSDGSGVKRATIASQNVSVSGPNNFTQLAQLLSVDGDRDGSPLTAIYSITAPGGVWDSPDTGTYTVTLQANQISDINGNIAPAGVLGTFGVDLTPPIARLSATNLMKGGNTPYSFTVTYSDTTAVKRDTIASQNVQVIGPKNFSQLAKLVSLSSNNEGNVLTATYSVDARDGVWNSKDIGTYKIALQANQVSDTSGNFIPTGVLGAFRVMIAPNDFNGDGKTDVLWDNPLTNQVRLWLINGTQIADTQISANLLGLNWSISQVGDFNGDAKSDILWRKSTGELAISLSDGTKLLDAVTLPYLVASDWKATIGDFNGDGKSDLFWRNQTTNATAVWLFDGTKLLDAVTLPYLISSDWSSVVGDFNGDGKSDLFWRNQTTNATAVWLFDGTKLLDAVTLPYLVASDWSPVVGDFNGDGKSDLFWRNQTTNATAVWLFDGTKLLDAVTLPYLISSDWKATTGDFNGDGKTDLRWYNLRSHEVALWLMDGTQLLDAKIIGNNNLDWTIAQASNSN